MMFEGHHAKIRKVKPDEYVELEVYKNSGRVKVDRYETVDYNRFLFGDYRSHMWWIEPEDQEYDETPKWVQHGRDMFDYAWDDIHPTVKYPQTFEEKCKTLVNLSKALRDDDPRHAKLDEFINTGGKSWIKCGRELPSSLLPRELWPDVHWL